LLELLARSLAAFYNQVMKGCKMKNATPSNTSVHVQQLQTALIRRKAVESLTSLSRSRIYALMAADDFPKPVKLGTMSVAWLEAEIHEWIASRIADRKAVKGAHHG
jgi:prophage regulatory protein